MVKNEVIEMMKTQIVEVNFKKLDGSMRKMDCTLSGDIIPPATKEDPLSQKKVRAVNEEVCAVWDCEKQDWRAFRWENLVNVNGVSFVHGDK